MYRPTDMHNVLSLGKGQLYNGLPNVEDLCGAILEVPSTEFSLVEEVADYLRPRSLMILMISIEGLMTECLIKGIQQDETGILKLLQKGSVSKEEINAISKIKMILDYYYKQF
jgi:hypothetical protein